MDGEAAGHLEPAQQDGHNHAGDIGIVALLEQAADQDHRHREHRQYTGGIEKSIMDSAFLLP